MNVITQIFSILYSAIMGVALYFISYFNYKFIEKVSLMWKYVLTTILIMDFTLAYIVGLYYINNGIVHIYFLLVVCIFFLISVNVLPRFLKIVSKKQKNDIIKIGRF